MKFYNREDELGQLSTIEKLSSKAFFFMRLTGRRRIGKTALVQKWSQTLSCPVLFFYVTRQNETTILAEFQRILAEKFPEYQSVEFRDMNQFFKTIFDLHVRKKVITIFDEFQEFQWVANQSFSIIQKELDLRKNKMKGILLTIGSLQSMMTQLFEDAKQPLFGRLNADIHCRSFSPKSLELLFDDKKIAVNKRLDLYTVFHGIPFYYNLIDDYRLWHKSIFTIIEELSLKKNSILVDEGRQLLMGEFGKNYSAWFSILKTISLGNTRLSEIVNKSGVPMKNINRYLNELMHYFRLVKRQQPLGAKSSGKISRYYIADRFLDFWFRTIYRNQSLLEIGSTHQIVEKIKNGFSSYKGFVFEEYCKELLIEHNQTGLLSFDEIGSWWDRGETEIDIITINHEKKSIRFYECKLQGKRYDKKNLEEKASVFLKSANYCKSYKPAYTLLAADNWQGLHSDSII